MELNRCITSFFFIVMVMWRMFCSVAVRSNVVCFESEVDYSCVSIFFFQAEDGIRDLVRSRGLGDVYKRQTLDRMLAFTDSSLRNN